MRAVFFGTPDWAVPSLERVAASAHEILAVVTQPDRRSSRGRPPGPPPVARCAARLGLEIRQPVSVRAAEFLDWFRAKGPDIGVVVAYGAILPDDLLRLAPRGFVNLHFSLLPKYRGAAPVQRAIAAGETLTGVTTMAIARRLDAGDVYLARQTPIAPDDTAATLGRRLAGIGAGLLVETLDGIEAGNLRAVAQNEAEATRAPSLRKEEGRVDWSLPAEAIARRIRAFDPWPGCSTALRGRRLRLLAGRAEPPPGGASEPAPAAPGTVLGLADGELRIACGAGSVLSLSRLQAESGRPLSAAEAVNGRILAPGDVLGEPDADGARG